MARQSGKLKHSHLRVEYWMHLENHHLQHECVDKACSLKRQRHVVKAETVSSMVSRSLYRSLVVRGGTPSRSSHEALPRLAISLTLLRQCPNSIWNWRALGERSSQRDGTVAR